MEQAKLPISAIVVGFNEEEFIEKCLSSVTFCEEIIFIDLGSSDSTLEIAEKLATKTYLHERVPAVEIIHHKFVSKVRYDWVLVIDPDEQISDDLQLQIINLFKEGISENIGGVIVPWIFYFKRKRLLGTPWGGVNEKNILFNRNKYELLPIVHRGRSIIDPYVNKKLKSEESNFLYHYWMTGYCQFLEKHRRYIKAEPESRYKSGRRTSRIEICKTPYKAFKFSFWTTKGYRNKFTGLFLSLFWAWYETRSLMGLYAYQKKEYNK